ncbi:unnamed protein product [Peniophora sp. CBMAI 1063]|nr:unnamed protein product [Peniophora sp. CBMAI 1063]
MNNSNPLQSGTSTYMASARYRPHPLPLDLANPRLASNDAYAVKFQEILRDGESLVIARVKVSTPIEHAFVLRRLDTGAISLTSMFRAAFPGAPLNAEKNECRWVKTAYDTSGANREGGALFSGTWVPTAVAQELAPSYRLDHVLKLLLAAEPTPSLELYRGARTMTEPRSSIPARNTSRPRYHGSVHTAEPHLPNVSRRGYAKAPTLVPRRTPVGDLSTTGFLPAPTVSGRAPRHAYNGVAGPILHARDTDGGRSSGSDARAVGRRYIIYWDLVVAAVLSAILALVCYRVLC